MRRFTCSDLERVGAWSTRFCCDSCHEDEAMGYDMCEHDLPGTDDYLATCCRVEIDELGDLRALHRNLIASTQE